MVPRHAIQRGNLQIVEGKGAERFIHGLSLVGLHRDDLSKVSFVLESYRVTWIPRSFHSLKPMQGGRVKQPVDRCLGSFKAHAIDLLLEHLGG